MVKNTAEDEDNKINMERSQAMNPLPTGLAVFLVTLFSLLQFIYYLFFLLKPISENNPLLLEDEKSEASSEGL